MLVDRQALLLAAAMPEADYQAVAGGVPADSAGLWLWAGRPALAFALWRRSRRCSRQGRSSRQSPDFHFASRFCCCLGLDALLIDSLSLGQIRHGVLRALQSQTAWLAAIGGA